MTQSRGRASHALVAFAVLFFTSLLHAQTPPAEVTHLENFQTYTVPSNPPGWIDTAIGQPSPTAQGLFKVWPDPTQGSKGENLVYGTKQASGKPEGNRPRIGTFSTLTTKSFDGHGRFEYRGRFIRTNTDSRIGLTFFSQYPESDRYYLVGLWSQAGTSDLTMQVFAHRGVGADGLPLGSFTEDSVRDSGYTPLPNVWTRFLIQSEVIGGTTNIRARFWKDGEIEPQTFSINAQDSSIEHLTAGRIGVWAAVKGESYIDEIQAKSPVDVTAPVIDFFEAPIESNLPLPDGKKFNRDVTPVIRVTDDVDVSTPFTSTLDGQPYTSGTVVTTEGRHLITAHTVDSAGNTSDAQVSFVIDKTAPVVTLLAAGQPLTSGRDFDADVTPLVHIEDLTATIITATLDGNPFEPATDTLPGTTVATEAAHTLVVSVGDEVGWVTALPPVLFTLDKTAPVVKILLDGAPFAAGAYNRDLALEIVVEDLTPLPPVITLDGQPYLSGTPITAEAPHQLTVTATDRLGHVTIVGPILFEIDKTKPSVRIIDRHDDAPLLDASYLDHDPRPAVEISDASSTAVTATLDGVPYILLTPITTEAPHELTVRVVDNVGWEVLITIHFTIDKTPPTLEIRSESATGQPLTPSQIFDHDVTLYEIASDTNLDKVEGTLNGASYPLRSLIDDERQHAITIVATDKAGNTRTVGPVAFFVDKTAPEVRVVDGAVVIPDGFYFNRDIAPLIVVNDLTLNQTIATLNGQPFTSGTQITSELLHTIAVTATDHAGHETVINPVTFTIDKTNPALTISSHSDAQIVGNPAVVVTGDSDDAKTVIVNGVSATVDGTTKRYTSKTMTFLEGSNDVTVIGTDRAGNVTTREIDLLLDTRAPVLTVLSPAAGQCLFSAVVLVQGSVSDTHPGTVTVSLLGANGAVEQSLPAVVNGGNWSVNLPIPGEGRKTIAIEARDRTGHSARQDVAITVDRTNPVIEVTESGAPFNGATVNRAIALGVKATDASTSLSIVTTLDGAPYVPGTSISGETAHVLNVTATDCANNTATRTINFTIDRTAPVIGSLTPANGRTVGTLPTSITGTVSNDTATVSIVNGPSVAPAPPGSFTLAAVSFAEGVNRFTLQAIDHAGNRTELAYVVTVRTEAPTIEIIENGTPIAAGALFNRAVTPVIRVSDSGATVTATLNGAAFVSGTNISSDGNYTIAATATDTLGHSRQTQVTFTIDRTPPVVTITSPANGSVVQTGTIEVRGSAGDSTTLDVNGYPTTISAGAYVVTIPLEEGEHRIVAAGRDTAGNTGSAEITITRDLAGPGFIVTSPVDGSLTNRNTARVLGRIVTPGRVNQVEVRTQGPGVRGQGHGTSCRTSRERSDWTRSRSSKA